MKILYGVQGTGNGHITRARVMAEALNQAGIEVDWVFSGRSPDKFFDMEAFGVYRVFKGLTFQVNNGKIDVLKTVSDASLLALWRDIRTLKLETYDHIITDYEPVVAWAAKRAGLPCLGIGHQYAFEFEVDKAGHSLLAESIMRWFAPVSQGLGVHWHHYNANILPPIIEPIGAPTLGDDNTVLVYLPFENTRAVMGVLQGFSRYRFIFHCADCEPGLYGNITVRGFSREGFMASLAESGKVICNAGFELASESLALGKSLLVKPVHGQMEQSSNALALQNLGLGAAMEQVDATAIAHFLEHSEAVRVHYPDVAAAIVKWLQQSPTVPVETLVRQLWAEVRVEAGSLQQAA